MDNSTKAGGEERHDSSLAYFKKHWQLYLSAIIVLSGFTIGYLSTNIEFPILSNFLPELIPGIILRNLFIMAMIIIGGLVFSVISIPFAWAQAVYSGVGLHIVHGHLVFEVTGFWLALTISLRLTTLEVQYLRGGTIDGKQETKTLLKYGVIMIGVVIFGAIMESLYGV